MISEYSGIDYLLVATAAAVGNRVLFWYQSTTFTRRELVYSLLYVITGSGIGYLFGIYLDSILIALMVGGSWPLAVDATQTVREVIRTTVQTLTSEELNKKSIKDLEETDHRIRED